jgi:DNA-binding beta-propeller fold protein YncE
MLTTVAAGRVFDYSYSIGMSATSGKGFSTAQDFALGANGRMYVVSRGVEELGLRVSTVTLDHEFLGQFGGFGSGDGQFVWPRSIELDQDERVYVSDEYRNQISIFDREGGFLSSWGQAGTGDGELNGPSGLAFDSDNNLYVVDSLNNRIQKFTKDGKPLGKWGQQGDGDGQFNLPWGICLDGENNVYVADWQNDRVQVLSPDGRFIAQLHGDHVLSQWGKRKLLSNPGMLRQRTIAFANDGGSFERGFGRPCAVKIDNSGRLVVLEHFSARIQIYVKSKDPVLV